jgi:uncharacterized membrane protein
MSFGKVQAGNGVNWLTEGFRLVMANPVAFLVMGLIVAVINFIPILGGLALTICGPALLGGVVYAAREQSEGGKAEIGHLFRAFQEPGKIGPMLLLCLPAIAGGVVLLICGMVFGLGALIGGLSGAGNSTAGMGALGGGFAIMVVICVAVMFVIYALQFFAVPRVMLDGVEPFAAMKESLAACLANVGAFIVFGVVLAVSFIVLAIVLSIIPLLGWLALIMAATVVFACGEYAAYKEVYADGASSSAAPPPPPPPPGAVQG